MAQNIITSLLYVAFACLIGGLGPVGCAVANPAGSAPAAAQPSQTATNSIREMPVGLGKSTPARSRTYMSVLIE